MLVNHILHKQVCVIRNLFTVEAMLSQLHMRNDVLEHADKRCCTVLEADWQAVAAQLLLFLWLVLGSTDIEKLRQMPSGLYSLQAVSNMNDLLQVSNYTCTMMSSSMRIGDAVLYWKLTSRLLLLSCCCFSG